MNVYIVEVAKRLAALGIEVDVFTRATSSELPPIVELVPGVRVRHVTAGPFEGLGKADLPAQLCAFTSGVLRTEAMYEPGHYDLVHSHYWLSGQVGWLAKERWGVPLVHSMHTMAKVKNASLADGDVPEPATREIGETQVVDAADRLVASTREEADQLVALYGAEPDRVATVAPGVDLTAFRPGSAELARRRLGLPPDAVVLLFVGRIQPLKAPDVLLRAAARMVGGDPTLRDRLVVAVVGGPSGTGWGSPGWNGPARNGRRAGGAQDGQGGGELDGLRNLAAELGVADLVHFAPPAPQDLLAEWYRAATAVVVPSYSESFGLVAIEAQACGTPVVAAAVGGLRTAIRDGVSGVLIDDHDPGRYADALRRIVGDPAWRKELSAGAVRHAERFGWSATVTGLFEVYTKAMADGVVPEALGKGAEPKTGKEGGGGLALAVHE
ncbi:MAG: glycosyltransferase [Streptosporangiales bacterium]|nr:glycosyltransferase [Streptosporangiales bacterium]